ncbi:cytosolic protein [Radiobacillus kanasensis]|uniref:cytosolic protein n=1 Tax=Radiobacillus kanasensis TaxID=2844358 RepID=UPI001E4AEBD1|nr:cytosolic protein [Radiobacillus kanasensis]UFT97998.1 cytosolic protein [Radiobacillus kanasensis]
MNVKQAYSKFIDTHTETNEHHWDSNLKTHYFKTTKDKAFEAVEAFFRKSPSFEIVAVSKEHGEVSVNYKKGKKAFVIATIIMVKPFRTAIDFSVTTESILPVDFGFGHKLISFLYKELGKDLILIKE